MRGQDISQDSMFSYGGLEERIPSTHPLRPIRVMVDEALRGLSGKFGELYEPMGRPSIAPEKLLRALLLMVLYSVRSERRLMEELNYNLLYRWFVGLGIDEAVWDATVFSKNRERFINGEIARKFFDQVMAKARAENLVSDDHFSVDGTLIEAWASMKSFQKKDDTEPKPPVDDPGNPTVNFRGEKRSNETHESKTDPDARLARKSKGQESKLAYCGNALIENRNGLVADVELLQANGTAERDAAVMMAERIAGTHRVTMAGDKGYDTKDLVKQLRKMKVTPHVAQNTTNRTSAIDQRTTRYDGYKVSLRRRKLVEEVFGWMKTVGGQRKTRYRGLWRVSWIFTFAAATYNLVRMRTLMARPVQAAAA